MRQQLVQATRVIPTRTRYGIVGVLAVLLVWLGAGTLAAPTRISPELAAEVGRSEGHVDIDIYFHEGPVRFHMTRYQQYGQLGRVDGDRLMLRRVEPDDVRRIARDYWIRWIDQPRP